MSGSKERKKEFRTISGAPVKRLYQEADLQTDYLKDINFPGQFPFTRGVQPTMYRGRLCESVSTTNVDRLFLLVFLIKGVILEK